MEMQVVLYQDGDKFCYEFTDFLSVLFRDCFENWEVGVVQAANGFLDFCNKEGLYVSDVEVRVHDRDSFMFAYSLRSYLIAFGFGSFTLMKVKDF